jgi:hypothetical protein
LPTFATGGLRASESGSQCDYINMAQTRLNLADLHDLSGRRIVVGKLLVTAQIGYQVRWYAA